MKLLPLHDFVLTKRKQKEAKTSGGLYIPDTAATSSLEAEVMAVGRGRMLEDGSIQPLLVKAGDVVLLPPSGGIDLKFENEDFVMVSEDRILAVLEQE